MSPKEKAEYLFSVFRIYPLTKDYGKYLSVKAVEEILKEIKDIDDGSIFIPYKYWQEVKKEIELL